MSIRLLIYILIALLFTGCYRNTSEVKPAQMEKELSVIENNAINALQTKRIFFGHASVGYNIITGIENIKVNDNRFSGIRIFDLKNNVETTESGIYHATTGKNGFPKSKTDGFKKVLQEKGRGGKFDIAFFKYCYVDFNKDTNVKEIFDYYSKTIADIKNEFPNLKIVHVTTPLYAHARGMKGFIKSLIYDDFANIKRNEFNSLLIEKYKNSDPIYDLAKIESTLEDGTRITFRNKGKTYFSLAKQYTDDGGHLNKSGQFYAAKELLALLSKLSLDTAKK